MKYGLSLDQLKEITKVLASYPEVESAVLFGSRAIDTFKEASDIDVAIKGKNADYSLALKLKDHFEDETDLPFFFDIISYSTIKSEDLKKHIHSKGKVIYRKGWREMRLEDIVIINKSKWQPHNEDRPYMGLEHIKEQELRLTGIDKDYLFYFLANQDFIDMTNVLSMGTRMPRADWNFLSKTKWMFPDIRKQKSIAEILSSFDDKIDLLHRQNKTLEDMAQTLFRQWFVERADDGWEERPLDKVTHIKYGKNLPIKRLKTSGYPVFGANGQIGFYEKYLYKTPQVLVSCRGEASGKVNISFPKSFITNNSLVLELRIEGCLTFEFLKYYALFTNFKRYVTGSAQPQITIENLSRIPIVIPPHNSIKRFSEVTSYFERKININKIQSTSLENQRDKLIGKLIGGDIRIK